MFVCADSCTSQVLGYYLHKYGIYDFFKASKGSTVYVAIGEIWYASVPLDTS